MNRSQWNFLKIDISQSYDGNTAVVDEAGVVSFCSLFDTSGVLKNLKAIGV